jgi:hypothetical protein
MYDNPWNYEGNAFLDRDIENFVGFVYIISNRDSGKFYIGKKTFIFKKKLPPLKGKKRKRTKLIESDWKHYYGSSSDLNEDIEKYGKNKFSRKILKLCKTKTEMTYYEAKYQFEMGVLTEENCYNKWIVCKVRKSNIK